MGNLGNLVDGFRDQIFNSDVGQNMQSDQKVIGQLVSALDTVADTDLALDAYLGGSAQEHPGERYLRLYGALQALVVQQDAIGHISECFEVPIPPDHNLQRIRDIRNASIGHPSKQDRPAKKPVRFNHIVRMTLSDWGFDLGTFTNEGVLKKQRVDLSELIDIQRGLLMKAFKDITAGG